MISLKCDKCNAELVPGARFCRQCGASVTSELQLNADALEQPTAVLGAKPDNSTTQKLRPRATSPAIGGRSRTSASQKILIFALLFVFIMGFVSVVKFVKRHNATASPDATSYFYPGAVTVMNLTNQDGSRSIQLETTDPLNAVQNWYQNHLSINKSVRLTSNSVVLKNQKATITLAVENSKTHILVKARP